MISPQRLALPALAALIALVAPRGAAAAATAAGANPIRRILTMLQMVAKKVEDEGKKEQELMDKFLCYCSSSSAALQQEVAEAEQRVPQLQSDIKEGESSIAQLQEELKRQRADLKDAQKALDEATALRKQEAADFAKESTDFKTNIKALENAIAAMEKNQVSSFLQSDAASALRHFVSIAELSSEDNDALTTFLSIDQSRSEDGDEAVSPGSDEITGILKQLKDNMVAELADAVATEDKAIADFNSMSASKSSEIQATTQAIETKVARVGTMTVEVQNLKNDLDDTQESLEENQNFLADLQKNCKAKQDEWGLRQRTRSEELLALSDVIKMLNDEAASNLFKETLPLPARAPSTFLQVKSLRGRKVMDPERRRLAAMRALKKAGTATLQINLIALAMRGRKVDFTKIGKLLEDMVTLLGQEQTQDDKKKAYCRKEFDESEDKKKELEQAISDIDTSIAEDAGIVKSLQEEVSSLVAGIAKLDKQTMEATEVRKQEHDEFVETLASNNAAMELIEMAKQRMNSFYAARKASLAQQGRDVLSFGQAGSAQTSKAAPGPAPKTFSSSYDTKAGNSIIKLMDQLQAEIKAETAQLKSDEAEAQTEYEHLLEDSKEKRSADAKSVSEKEGSKANLEAGLHKFKASKKDKMSEMTTLKGYIASMHAECDTLMETYDKRKAARAAEVDALKKAQGILMGWDA